MAALSTLSITLFLLVCFTSFALLSLTTIAFTRTATITKPRRIATKLIQHESLLCKPNNDGNVSGRVGCAVESTTARLAYLRSRTLGASLATDDIRSGVIPDTKYMQGFMANVSIGQPPVPQLLLLDTGSSLLWTQCLPCTKCVLQSVPLFNPSKSSTYASMSCFSRSCPRNPSGSCDSSNNCKFSQKYVDGTVATGVYATETLTFVTSDEGTTSVPHSNFGCASNVNMNSNGQMSGILGLYDGSTSLLSQVGSKFSYCLGRIRDPQYPYNQLILGDGAIIEGSSTPIEIQYGVYYLTIDGISVGDKKLDFDLQVLGKKPSGRSGTVIDSGTVLTVLARAAFDALTAEVLRLMDGLLQRSDVRGFEAPCWKGVISRDLHGFPAVTFHFANSVDLVLDIEAMFWENGPNKFCLALSPTENNGLSIIGILAQQNYNVGYDLSGKTISFQSIDCELLET